MKLRDVEKAADLARQLAQVEADLKRASGAAIFKLEMRENENQHFAYVGHCTGVSLNASGSFGELAERLQAAAVGYFQFHRAQIIEELNAIGVNT